MRTCPLALGCPPGCPHVASGPRPEPVAALLSRWGIGLRPDFTSEEIAEQTTAALREMERLLGGEPVQRLPAPTPPPGHRPWVAEGVREEPPDPKATREVQIASARARLEADAAELARLEGA